MTVCDKTAGGNDIYLCISSRPVPLRSTAQLSKEAHTLLFYRWLALPSVNTYQHLAAENSLGSTSIIQPKLYQRDGRRGTNQFAGMQAQAELSSCVWTEGERAISISCHGLNKAVGGDWAFLGVGRLEGKQTMSIVEVGNNCTSTWRDAVTYLCPALKKKKKWNCALGVGGLRWRRSAHAHELLHRGLLIIIVFHLLDM